MRVLGIDPGLTRCGVGIIDSAGPGRPPPLVLAGVIRTASTMEVGRRLLLLEAALVSYLER